jgi:hypothetical protein
MTHLPILQSRRESASILRMPPECAGPRARLGEPVKKYLKAIMILTLIALAAAVGYMQGLTTGFDKGLDCDRGNAAIHK